MAEDIKNLCAPIPSALHAQVRENQEASGKTLGQYMTWLITQFYEYEKGGTPNMADNKRTVAFQVPADLFESVQGVSGKESHQAERILLGLHPTEPLQMRQNKCSTMPCR